MLSEASISLYFECPKKRGRKGAERGIYYDIIRYLGTPIKQINPNKKMPYDSIRNHRATLENMVEEEGFEPPRRLPDLPHFECGPFSLLGTPPCFTALLKEVFHNLAAFIT